MEKATGKKRTIMSEPFKDKFSKDFIEKLGKTVKTFCPDFSLNKFVKEASQEPYAELELKARIDRISEKLAKYLPQDLSEAFNILFYVHDNLNNFPGIVLPECVTKMGLKEDGISSFKLSMEALAKLTIGSTSEFAIRPFIKKNTKKALEYMEKWSQSEKEDLRRLSSEGFRPRLPWSFRLETFIKDPKPILLVLDRLMEDDSLYVRKSVANNLNDISKDNPYLFLSFAKKWKGKSEKVDWILKKGARTLLKDRNEEVLKLFGFIKKNEDLVIKEAKININPKKINLGESIKLTYKIVLKLKQERLLRLEYTLDYPTKTGGRGSKIFFISEKKYKPEDIIVGVKTIPIKSYNSINRYKGVYIISIHINGKFISKHLVTVK
jgi:3-methyladenine DNA glycosylase AlkC